MRPARRRPCRSGSGRLPLPTSMRRPFLVLSLAPHPPPCGEGRRAAPGAVIEIRCDTGFNPTMTCRRTSARRTCSSNPHHRPQQLLVGRTGGEIVEGLLRHPDDMVLDEGRAFGGAVLWMLQAALPFQHRPGIVVVL